MHHYKFSLLHSISVIQNRFINDITNKSQISGKRSYSYLIIINIQICNANMLSNKTLQMLHVYTKYYKDDPI